MNTRRADGFTFLRRIVAAGLTTSVAAFSMVALAKAPASSAAQPPEVLTAETFRDTETTPGEWLFPPASKGTGRACLTAATSPPAGSVPACPGGPYDRSGDGVARLTDENNDRAGTLIFNKPLESGKGLSVSFDMFIYGGKKFQGRTADGLSVYLIDGQTTDVKAGEPGGALGYKGLSGALVGIGFDEFGNFSNPVWGGKGGPGNRPNHIAVRGGASTGYAYLTAKESPAPIAVPEATNREQAKRRVVFDLNANNYLTIFIDFQDGKGFQNVIGPIDLDNLPGQPKLPPTFKFGFAASTGDGTSFHEIRNLVAKEIQPDLIMKATGPGDMVPGGTGTVTLTVSNSIGAITTTSTEIRVTYEVEAGLTITSASGDGWTCTTESRLVTCTRPGSGADALEPGQSAPPITVTVRADATASGTITGTAKVIVSNDGHPDNNTATTTATIKTTAVRGPNLTIEVTGGLGASPGASGSLRLVVVNASGAGSTTGDVTLTFKAPSGLRLTTATGDGWRCSIAGSTVTCTRSDPLAGGSRYASIDIGYTIESGAPSTLIVEVTVTTTGETNPSDNTVRIRITVEQGAPTKTSQLAFDVTTSPENIQPGGRFTFTLIVRNTGEAAANGARLEVTWPGPFQPIRWTCKASDGGSCSTPSGRGDIDMAINVPAGGSVTITLACVMPQDVPREMVVVAKISPAPGTDDVSCPCGVRITITVERTVAREAAWSRVV